MGHDFLAAGNHLVNHGGAVALGEPGGHFLVTDVVGGLAGHADHIIEGGGFRSVYHGTMAVADTCVKLHRELLAQRVVQCGDDFFGFLGGDVVRREVLHHTVFEGDQVAAEGYLVIREVDALVGRLNGGTSTKGRAGVIAKHGEIANIATGRKSVGDGTELTGHAPGHHVVDGGGVGDFEGRPVVIVRQGPIGHAVAQKNKVFHGESPHRV